MPGKYIIGVPEIDKEIEDLAKKYSTPGTEELFRQIFTTVVKLQKEKADDLDLQIVNSTLKELRHAFKIFSRYRDVPKVTIWGSSRISSSAPEYKMALEFSKKISKLGYMIITGGGGGVMEAGNRGAGDKGFAVNIILPNIQEVNPFVLKGEKLIHFKYFFTRKLIFVKESDATVLFPGGFGTNDEAFEILTLFQTGKSMPRPIILVNAPKMTYWKTWLKFIEKEMLKRNFILKEHLKLFKVVNSVQEAIDEIVNFYRIYHSIRFVGPLTVLRLNKSLPESKVKELNKKFKDILIEGKIQPSGPTTIEKEQKDFIDLPRLVMKFDRHSYGRLNEMIRSINQI